MSNELVTFGRVPKSTMEESPKTPGKIWVTNDTEDNPDNFAEAYVDDTSNRRMKITDRDLVGRVEELESNSPISDPTIEQIVRDMGSNPASPYNFMNNIAFSNPTITYMGSESPAIFYTFGELEIPPIIHTSYNLLIISYIDSSYISTFNLVADVHSPINTAYLVIPGEGVQPILNYPNICKGFTNEDNGYPAKLPSGTYVFHLKVIENNLSRTITIENIYCFQKQQFIQVNTGNGKHLADPNSNLVAYDSFYPTNNWANLSGNVPSGTSIKYCLYPGGVYFLIDTNTTNSPITIDNIPYDTYSNIFSNLSNSSSQFVTLPSVYEECDTIGAYPPMNSNCYIEINRYTYQMIDYVKIELHLSTNSNPNMKRALFYLPKFLPAFPS